MHSNFDAVPIVNVTGFAGREACLTWDSNDLHRGTLEISMKNRDHTRRYEEDHAALGGLSFVERSLNKSLLLNYKTRAKMG